MADVNLSGRPPVNEVVLSFAFERGRPTSSLIGPRIRELLADDYPEDVMIEAAPPYIPPIEIFPVQPQVPLEFFLGQQQFVEPRYWIYSRANPAQLLQIQDGFLALNWRDHQDGREYSHYPEMRQDFVSKIGALHKRLGAPAISRVEMTYINLITEPSLPTDMFSVLQVSHVEELDSYGWNYSRSIGAEGTSTHGRLHVNLVTAWTGKDQVPAITLNLTARSADVPRESVASVLDFLDFGHDALNEEFRQIITPASRARWGIEDD